mgnify:CR=1 FL=1
MKFVVKLFPEITIKSWPVRNRLIWRLQSNLYIILQRIEPNIKVHGEWDFMHIECPPQARMHYAEIIEALGNTPGIAHVIEVQECCLKSLTQVLDLVEHTWSQRLIGKRFVVRVKRSGEHDFTPSQMEAFLGLGLLQRTQALKVDLHNPEVTVNIEVKSDRVLVVERRIDGLGGYPQGSPENVLSLISSGFDSTVASYLTIKRGAKTHFLFFNLGGAAHEAGVKQVAYYLWRKFGSAV